MIRSLLPALLLLSACDGLADDDYQGELLASLTGEVVSIRTNPTPPSQVLVLWGNAVPDPANIDVGFGSAAIEGSFPAAFRLDITTPPPPTLAQHDLAVGVIQVWPQRGHVLDVVDPLLGIEERHALLWIGDADAADEAAARWDMTAAPGLHVVDVLGLTPDEDAELVQCASAAGADLQPCLDWKREILMARYPEVNWAVVPVAWADHFRLAADDLDTRLSVALKDTSDDINFPQLPYPGVN